MKEMYPKLLSCCWHLANNKIIVMDDKEFLHLLILKFYIDNAKAKKIMLRCTILEANISRRIKTWKLVIWSMHKINFQTYWYTF